jgi:hypothetical protein
MQHKIIPEPYLTYVIHLTPGSDLRKPLQYDRHRIRGGWFVMIVGALLHALTVSLNNLVAVWRKEIFSQNNAAKLL